MLIAHPQELAVYQLGPLDSVQAGNALGVANSAQDAFVFRGPQQLDFDLEGHRFPNGGYDLDRAVSEARQRGALTEPAIVLSSLPYGDRDRCEDPEYYYFLGEPEYHPTSIISTYLWEQLPGRRYLEDFLLYMFGTVLLARLARLDFHSKDRGCIFDFCDDPQSIDCSLRDARLCSSCERSVGRAVSAGRISLPQYASVLRLLYRARGSKSCFVVMPFREQFDGLYARILRPALKELGWLVTRGDELVYPRIITDAIVLQILTADLVIADLTGSNPNVFYEVGVADAIGADVVFLIQQGHTIPFDVNQRRTIFYDLKKRRDLINTLSRFVGQGTQ